MKKKFAIAAITLLICLGTLAQSGSKKTQSPESTIRQYWFVLLTKGSNRDQDSVTAAKLQAGHLANIKRLYGDGKIKVAGPFGEKGDWQGIFIFDCDTKEEVEKLLNTDPAIAAGRMVYQIKSWYTLPIGSFAPGKPKEDLF
jgi:uncharacterized protein YciI